MLRFMLLASLFLGCALLVSSAVARAPGDDNPGGKSAPAYTISGPFTHENLSIFLLHGPDTLPAKPLLTLQEALEQKKAIVHETGEVNELSVENLAGDVDVYIQSGDILKGGRQDRIMAYDLLVPPKSGKVAIASFCVESGRWRQRGSEAAGSFSRSENVANSKDFKVAAQSSMRSQDQVWSKVREAQMKLRGNLGQAVENAQSPTSLQLTLEDKKLLEELDRYIKPLTRAPEGKRDVIGYAVAINGKVDAADVFGSHDLFMKLWPKLLNGSATEAFTEKQADKKFEQPTAESVKTFLVDSVKGKKTEKAVTARIKHLCQEDEKNLYQEVRDSANKDAIIHRSYLKK